MAQATDAPDRRYMQAAIGLARRALGRSWPNPAVGCVIVKDGAMVGRGWTQPGGRPHAETEALRRAAAGARGATLYSTLEPCSHVGRTPPCVDAIIAADVRRVVAAIEDPDPRVSGAGLARLADAGIEVVSGVLSDEAASVNRGYLLRRRHGRPMLTVKVATTLDGRIATQTGESKWITGTAARARGQHLRATHNAILIGIETALRDDPQLTCRLPGMGDQSPVRIVLDSSLRLPLSAGLVATAGSQPTWVVTTVNADTARAQALEDKQVIVIRVDAGEDGRPAIGAVVAALAEKGLNRVLVEGGGTVAGAFLRGDLADELAWFRTPSVMGGDGLAAVAPLGVDVLKAMRRFARQTVAELEQDVLETYIRRF